MTEPGVFTLSLDTELAWGSFDRGGIDRHAGAYRRTPEVVDRLCASLDRHDVAATWAFVGHLLEDCDGVHDGANEQRRAWLSRAPCSTGTDRSLWYAPALLERVLDSDVDHDVGLHGYSHLAFDEHDRATAEEELASAAAAAEAAGLAPTSFVFPRNRIAHADLLGRYGIEAHRGRDARWYERPAVPRAVCKPLRFADEALGLGPPTVVPEETGGGLRVPGSMPFRPDHGAWRATPASSRRRRLETGLERAAGTGRIFHLWLHPFNLGRNPDRELPAVDSVLARVAQLRDAGRLQVASLADVARMAREGRWRGDGADRRRAAIGDSSPGSGGSP